MAIDLESYRNCETGTSPMIHRAAKIVKIFII